MTVDPPQLTQAEHQRRALHRSVDRICDAWPQARLDADARGYPAGGGGRGPIGGHSDPTPNAALAEHGASGHAVAWLGQLHDIVVAVAAARTRIVWSDEPAVRAILHDGVDRLAAAWPRERTLVDAVHQLADLAALWWPPAPKTGDEVGGVTVGVRRTNQVGTCRLCGDPVVPGNGAQGRRWVQDPATGERLEFHKSPCFYRYYMDRQRSGPSHGAPDA